MKKLFALVAAGALSLCLLGCSGGGEDAVEEKAPADLTGTWVQTNSNSETDYQEAVISDGYIEINWIGVDTKSLYWAGDYIAPTTADEPYVWTSTNDRSKTDTALLASTAETKDFTYEDGELSYEASALGTTMTIRMERQE